MVVVGSCVHHSPGGVWCIHKCASLAPDCQQFRGLDRSQTHIWGHGGGVAHLYAFYTKVMPTYSMNVLRVLEVPPAPFRPTSPRAPTHATPATHNYVATRGTRTMGLPVSTAAICTMLLLFDFAILSLAGLVIGLIIIGWRLSRMGRSPGLSLTRCSQCERMPILKQRRRAATLCRCI